VRDAPVIAIVDDDESFREALERFLGTFAFRVRTFASGEEFLQSRELGFVACLLLDLVVPGMSGLEVKQQLGARGLRIPPRGGRRDRDAPKTCGPADATSPGAKRDGGAIAESAAQLVRIAGERDLLLPPR